ncbi:interleukin-18 receptor accessory protein-like [Acanthochromis polyacanthus]|uniref:interleukin-18 receptor accessory protein-like n=1 Tax=Acanthochromis polyacanthus TaxID=80966 RepID=UPI0022345251|nr:interleukin-18 receptor accessory protein-like [Acanthochromis polyacanthus]
MPTEYVLFLLIFPSLSVGCCGSQWENKAHQRDTTHLHYRAVEGETFTMPCIISSNQKTKWLRTGQGGEENKDPPYPCGTTILAERKLSANYTDLTRKRILVLEVVEKPTSRCFQPEKKRGVTVLLAVGGKLTCPDFTCSNNTDVTWYKDYIPVNTFDSCEEEGVLRLCQVREAHQGLYFCDRRTREGNVTWMLRRPVLVKVGPRSTQSYPPRITYPVDNNMEEVELGLPYNLTCEVFFPLEIEFFPKVVWYVNYNGNKENMTLLPLEEPIKKREIHEEIKITQISIIKEVTPQHLNHMYTCSTQNTDGSSSVTIKLKRKIKVIWPCLVAYPIVCFLMLAMLGGILHLKRLELQLIYKSYFQYGNHDTDEKQFDVFLSYVRSPSPVKTSEGFSLSSKSGSSKDVEACQSTADLLSTDDAESTQGLLEMLLPQVLEDQWGYRLHLLDRDPLPGGAYTNDVVLAIARSRMLICVLSADYLTSSNAVFELESGVQALLQKSAPKLLLIWTSGASGSLNQVDPPLPALVQKALRVLPSLTWSSSKPATAESKFWRSLRKAMPHAGSETGFSHTASSTKLC